MINTNRSRSGLRDTECNQYQFRNRSGLRDLDKTTDGRCSLEWRELVKMTGQQGIWRTGGNFGAGHIAALHLLYGCKTY